MQSVSPTRRLSAIVALVAVVAVLAVAVVGLLQRPLVLVVALACLGVAIAAAAYALTRTGARRLLAAVVAMLALAAPLALWWPTAGCRSCCSCLRWSPRPQRPAMRWDATSSR